MDDFKWFARTAERLPDKFWIEGHSSEQSAPCVSSPLQSWIDRAHRAPVGRGPDTVTDENVRKCLEVEQASDLSEEELPHWGGLDEALKHIAQELTPGFPLRADFYKLLIYRPGDYFKSHRDSKKGKDHIITLSVVCGILDGDTAQIQQHTDPNSGGELVFTDNRPPDAKWETRGGPGAYAAWFNTEEHEVTPLREGHRVMLTYNVSLADCATASPKKPLVPHDGINAVDQSALSWLPAEVLYSLIDFCPIQDKCALRLTCRSVCKFLSSKSIYVAYLAEQLQARRSALLKRLLRPIRPVAGPNTSMALFLKHEYSFDGQRHIDPRHLRGSDALLLQAVQEAFPDAVCETREAFLHYTRQFSRLRGEGELMELMARYDYENLIVVQAATPPNVWQEAPRDNGAYEGPRLLTVKEKYRHLLPAGVSHIYKNYHGKGLHPSEYDAETGKQSCLWPFFHTVFALRDEDIHRVFRHRILSGRSENHDLGNEGWQSEDTLYGSACLIIHFKELQTKVEKKLKTKWARFAVRNPQVVGLGDYSSDPEVRRREILQRERDLREAENVVLMFLSDRHWKHWYNLV